MRKGQRTLGILSLVVVVLLFFGYPTYFFIINNSPEIKHETNRWMLIRDNDGNKIAFETINSSLWDSLTMSYQEYENEGEPMSILGVVVSYDNSWQFRLDPSTISMGYGFWKMETYTISEITTNLELHLSTTVAIYFASIQFNNFKNTGMIPFIVDMIVSVVSILLFSLYFFFKRERNLSAKIKETLLGAKENPEGISFALLSQNVGLKQKQIEKLIQKRNLEEDLGLQITNDRIEFKELIYSKKINRIEEELKDIIQLTSDQLTPEHFSMLFQFKTDLEEALVYYKTASDKEQQYQINTKLEVITEFQDSIKLEDLK